MEEKGEAGLACSESDVLHLNPNDVGGVFNLNSCTEVHGTRIAKREGRYDEVGG